MWLPAADQAVLLEALGRVRQRLDALLMHTLTATSDPVTGVGSMDASRSPADWLARRLRVRPGRLAGEAKLGAALAERPVLAAALAAGEVTVEHARAVTGVLADLPTSLDAATMVEAEQTLVGYCDSYTPPQVRHLGTSPARGGGPRCR